MSPRSRNGSRLGARAADIKSTGAASISRTPLQITRSKPASFTVYDDTIYRGSHPRARRYYAFDPAGTFVGSFISQLKPAARYRGRGMSAVSAK